MHRVLKFVKNSAHFVRIIKVIDLFLSDSRDIKKITISDCQTVNNKDF